MNYIYDVVTNFNFIPYNFFEWNKSDNITHLKKVLIIRINREVMNDLIYKKVKISEELLKYIKNKTEFYSKVESNYICIFTDTYTNICIKFTKDGVNKDKSFLQVEEDEETLEISHKLNETNFNYQIFGNTNYYFFQTRKQIERNNYVLKNIESLYNNNDTEKLRYIYYDCFNDLENDTEKIIDKIKKEIISDDKITKQICDFFKLLSVKKNIRL